MSRNNFCGTIRLENINYDADAARVKKAEIDQMRAEQHRRVERGCKIRRTLFWALFIFTIAFFVLSIITCSGKIALSDSELLTIGMVGFASLLTAILVAICNAPDASEIRYPASVKFCTIVDGRKIESSWYAELGTGEYRYEAAIHIITINDDNEISHGDFNCQIKYKKGLSEPILNLKSNNEVLYLPYTSLRDDSRVNHTEITDDTSVQK